MDGTLVDSLMLWDVFWKALGEKYSGDKNFRPNEKDEKTVRTLTLKDAMELVHKNYNFGESGEELVNLTNEILIDFYSNKVELKSGVLEFLDGKYSRNANFAGMICFIEEFKNNWDMGDIIVKINEKLNESNISSLKNTPHTDYEHVYRLTAPRTFNDEDINIIHLMLDYSSIYSNN